MEANIQFNNTDYDISVQEIENHQSNGIDSHFLKLLFKGDDINHKIINMIRRVCSNYIPIYAYSPDLINIIENTSVAFNNDMMKLDLSLLPVFNIDPELYELDEEYWNIENYADTERKRHPNEKSIEFYVAAHNNSSDIINVTTNDANITINGEQTKMYNTKYPILLIQLKPNQSFKCHMRAVLGIAERRDDGSLWKACKRSFFWENDDGYTFTVYGNEMFSEYDLIIRACKYIISRLQKIKNAIIEKNIPDEKTIEFVLDDEDHTLGEPINYELQDHEDILSSGFSKSDHLIKTGVIKARCIDKKKSPNKAFIDSIGTVINKVHKIGYNVEKIYGKVYKKDSKENIKKDVIENKKEKVKKKNKK